MLPNSLYLRHMTNILVTTTPTVENRPIREYLGIVSGEAFMDEKRKRYRIFDRRILEYNFDRHSHKLLSKRADFIPGSILWVIAYRLRQMCKEFWELKAEFHKAQKQAIREMAEEAAKLGANAVIGVKIDYKTTGGFSGGYDRSSFSMYAESVWVIATGTAVRL